MRIGSTLALTMLVGCTLNVQSVARVTATGATGSPLTTLRADLRDIATLEDVVQVRGASAPGASATVALAGLVGAGERVDAVAPGARITWTDAGAGVVALGLRYEGPSPDSVSIVGLALAVSDAAALEIDGDGASFDVAGVTGAVRVHTNGWGAVTVADAASADVANDGGPVDVTVHGEAIVTTTGGRVRVDAGSVVITNTGGNVTGTVRGAGGSVVTHGGEAQLDLATTLSGDLAIDTDAGRVTLGVPAGASFVLDVASSSGGVHVSANGVSHTGSPFVATFGSGGPRVSVRTTAGEIDVVQR